MGALEAAGNTYTEQGGRDGAGGVGHADRAEGRGANQARRLAKGT